MKKILILFLLLVLILNIPVISKASDMLEISAESALLMDLETGQILYSKDIHKRLAPASTTKILTAIIVLERCKLNDIVTVGKTPPYEDGSKIYLIDGEMISVENLLYAMLLDSANDAALALAEHISGSKEGFAQLMNTKAREIGCTDTNFVNPNGLYDDNHYTTAYDLALIAKKAMEYPKFKEIVATKAYQIGPTNKQHETRYIYNRNRIVNSTKYKYEGADGVKNGYTTKSKNTLVASATRGNRRLLAVELMDNSELYYDAIKLLDYGFNNFTSQKILSVDTAESSLKIKGLKNTISLYPLRDYYASVHENEEILVSKNVILNKSYKSIKKGDIIGYMELTIDGSIKTLCPLAADSGYSSFIYYLQQNKAGEYSRKLKPLFKNILYTVLIIFLLKRTLIFIKRKKRRNRLIFSKHTSNNKFNH